MSKVLVLYYSSYGHIEAMANAVAEGARQTGAHVDIKRVPELVPEEIARKSHYKLDQAAPIAKVEDLSAYDAIIIGAGTRFGRLPSQMANFLDQGGARSIARQSRRRVQFERHATWRAGDDAVFDHHQPAAFRHDRGRPELWLRRPDEARRDHRRRALRRHHDHGRRWLQATKRKRACRRALSRSRDRGDSNEAAWLMRPGRHLP